MFRLIIFLPLFLSFLIGCSTYPSVDVVNDNLENVYFKLNVPIYSNWHGARDAWLETLRVYSKCPPNEDMWYVTSMWPNEDAEPMDNRPDLDFLRIQYGKAPPGFYSPFPPKPLKAGCAYYVSAGYLDGYYAEAIFVCDENGCKVPMAEKLEDHRLATGKPEFDCGSCK